MRADPKRQKRQSSHQFFALLESAGIKAAPKMLVKSTPGLSQNEVHFL
jgi:hypothetical protein